MPRFIDLAVWRNRYNQNHHLAIEQYYSNSDAIEKVVRYITRTRRNETRADDLICYGGAGITTWASVEQIIMELMVVQEIYGINRRGGRRLYHYTVQLSEAEFNLLRRDISLVNLYARRFSDFFYNAGHQVVYAVHSDMEKKLHIHFVVSSINFRTGRKYHSGYGENDIKLQHLIKLAGDLFINIVDYCRLMPIFFYSDNNSKEEEQLICFTE